VISDGDDVEASGDTGALGEPVAPVDEPASGTLIQGEPDSVTETISDTLPEAGGGSSTEMRGALLGGGADSLPLTGLGLLGMLLTGLMLFLAGALARQRSVATG
jgi:hypothetical protein